MSVSWPPARRRSSRRVGYARSAPVAMGSVTCPFTAAGHHSRSLVRRDAAVDRSLRLNQSATDGVARQLDAVTHPELVEDVLAMAVDRLDADEQSRSDVFRGLRLRD